jgi:hypothetical protein
MSTVVVDPKPLNDLTTTAIILGSNFAPTARDRPLFQSQEAHCHVTALTDTFPYRYTRRHRIPITYVISISLSMCQSCHCLQWKLVTQPEEV